MAETEVTRPELQARVILQLVAGSNAHGTTRAISDIDTRTVYLVPTSIVLSLSGSRRLAEETKGDENRWELGRFLYHGLGASPGILEALLIPPAVVTPEGAELRQLFPLFLSHRVKNAFGAYAEGQKKLMQSPRSTRREKAGGDYLRVLYNGIELLETGTMTVRIADTPVGDAVVKVREGQMPFDEVLSIGAQLERRLERALAETKLPARPDAAAIDEYLLRVRRANF